MDKPSHPPSVIVTFQASPLVVAFVIWAAGWVSWVHWAAGVGEFPDLGGWRMAKWWKLWWQILVGPPFFPPQIHSIQKWVKQCQQSHPFSWEWFTHSTYKNGDDWGMVYDCFTHMIWLVLNVGVQGYQFASTKARQRPLWFARHLQQTFETELGLRGFPGFDLLISPMINHSIFTSMVTNHLWVIWVIWHILHHPLNSDVPYNFPFPKSSSQKKKSRGLRLSSLAHVPCLKFGPLFAHSAWPQLVGVNGGLTPKIAKKWWGNAVLHKPLIFG